MFRACDYHWKSGLGLLHGVIRWINFILTANFYRVKSNIKHPRRKLNTKSCLLQVQRAFYRYSWRKLTLWSTRSCFTSLRHSQSYNVYCDPRIDQSNSPYARLLRVGWMVTGEACLGTEHKPETINTIRILHNGCALTLQPCPNDFELKTKVMGVHPNLQ